jgi:NAD-dependent dihydropyrimidine dehydrogenase PreA subunit
MIDVGIEMLVAAGMPKGHILYDKFEDMRSPAPVIDNIKCVLCDECLMAKPQPNCIVEVSKLYRDAVGQVTGYERVDPARSSGIYYNTLYIDERECIRCGACVEACPTNAISPGNSRNPRALRAALTEVSGNPSSDPTPNATSTGAVGTAAGESTEDTADLTPTVSASASDPIQTRTVEVGNFIYKAIVFFIFALGAAALGSQACAVPQYSAHTH